jgi:hypothetical protein
VSDAAKALLASGGLFTGVVGLLIFVGRLVFTGKLVPRSQLEDTTAQYKERLLREAEISNSYRVTNEALTVGLNKQLEMSQRIVDEQKLITNFIYSLEKVRDQQHNPAAVSEGKPAA